MENRLWRWLTWILAAVIFIAIGYGLGFGHGFADGIKFAVHIGLDFVKIDIDEDKMIKLINLYQRYCNNDGVDDCLKDLRLNKNFTL